MKENHMEFWVAEKHRQTYWPTKSWLAFNSLQQQCLKSGFQSQEPHSHLWQLRDPFWFEMMKKNGVPGKKDVISRALFLISANAYREKLISTQEKVSLTTHVKLFVLILKKYSKISTHQNYFFSPQMASHILKTHYNKSCDLQYLTASNWNV